MASKASATGKPQGKRKRGNPNLVEVGKATQFKPNDPVTGEIDERINRKGTLKPRSQKELESLLDEIFDEEIEVTLHGQKQKITQLQAALIDMLRNKNISGRIELLARRFGKVPQPIEGKLTTENVVRIITHDDAQGDNVNGS